MTTATITRKSRNLGIAGTAYANNGPNGWFFAPIAAPHTQGGCATNRNEIARYQKMWSGGTYYRVDVFVGGKRVAHSDATKLLDFCADPDRWETHITVCLDNEQEAAK
jgi:hypothetical protein